MAKKHRRYSPQSRKRLKETTGKREFVNVVYLEKERIPDAETGEIRENVYATCTCTWRSSDEARTIVQVANEAKTHVADSGGKCRLRQHYEGLPEVSTGEGTPDPLSEEAVL